MSLTNGGIVLIKSAKDLFDPGAFLAKVGAGKSISELQKGDIVFAQGDVADTVFYIQKGKIKLVVGFEEGKEAIVGILESGQFFGEGCLNGRRFRVATTAALEVSVVTRISKEAMTRMLEIEPKFAQLFMMHLISRNSRIEEDLVDQLFNPRNTWRASCYCWRSPSILILIRKRIIRIAEIPFSFLASAACQQVPSKELQTDPHAIRKRCGVRF